MKSIVIPVAMITCGSSLPGDEWEAPRAPGFIEPKMFQLTPQDIADITAWLQIYR